MNRRSLGALVALNVLLLAALAVTSLAPAPVSGQIRTAKGDYRMVAGTWTGGGANRLIVYILDGTSSKVLPVTYDSAANTLTPCPGRIVNEDLGR